MDFFNIHSKKAHNDDDSVASSEDDEIALIHQPTKTPTLLQKSFKFNFHTMKFRLLFTLTVNKLDFL